MQYITVDQIIHMVSKYGPGTLRANFYIKAACRNIAVHRLIVYFFGGMKWRGKYFVDLTPGPLFLIQSQAWWNR